MNYRLETTPEGKRWVKQVWDDETESIVETPLAVGEKIVCDPDEFLSRSNVMVLPERERVQALKEDGTPQSLEDFIAELGPPPEFKPNAWYNEPGDLIEVYWSNEDHVHRHLNRQLELKVSTEDRDKVTGVMIWGVRKMLLKAYANADKPMECFTFKALNPNYKPKEE